MFCRICYTKPGEPKLCPACYKRVEESLFREEERVVTNSRR